MQALNPELEYVPTAQFLHITEPEVAAYCPVSQLAQALEPAAAKVPAEQLVHEAERSDPSSNEEEPPGHEVQLPPPGMLWNVPALQLVHAVGSMVDE